MKTKSLDDLFLDMLKDVYYAERKILKALPKMARGARSPELQAAFEKHREETELQIERLQQVFELIGKPARGKTCPAIEGIIEEGEEIRHVGITDQAARFAAPCAGTIAVFRKAQTGFWTGPRDYGLGGQYWYSSKTGSTEPFQRPW